MSLEFNLNLGGGEKVKQVVDTMEAENIPEGAVLKVMQLFKDYNITEDQARELVLEIRQEMEKDQKSTEAKIIKMNHAPEDSDKEVMDL